MITQSHGIPRDQPPGFEYLKDEPEFDEARDLQLEMPRPATSLQDLGYSSSFQNDSPSPLAISDTFRILSSQGVEKFREVIEQLNQTYIPAGGTGGGAIVRSAVYKSRFVRDLVLSSRLTDFLSTIAGTGLMPSSYAHQLAHANIAGTNVEDQTPAWHCDNDEFVTVLMLHDPNSLDGGEFQYYRGTRTQGERAVALDGEVPEELVASPHFQGAGTAVLLQGFAVFHRAAPQTKPAYRVSVVTPYDARDIRYSDKTRSYFVAKENAVRHREAELERYCRFVDYARHQVLRMAGLLDDFLSDVNWTESPAEVLRDLEAPIEVMKATVEALQA
jgi:hypothetical protein